MKIKSFHVNGFGILHNTGIDNISSGLNIFTGDNESGKSTLLRFIRSVLFGMSRNSPRDEPLQGGSHGGTMEIDLENGNSLIFELRNRKVHVSNQKGDPLDHVNGLEQIGGIDRHLFERVFAVGLDDLYLDADSLLDEDKLRNRLFAAGAGLGEISISETFSKLEKEMQKLARNRSIRSRSLIRDDSSRLREVQKEIRQLAHLEDEYAHLEEQKELLSSEIGEITLELDLLRKNEMELKRLHSLVEPYARLQCVKKEIFSLEENVKDLPAGAKERYADIKRNITFYKDKLGKLERDMENIVTEKSHLKVNSRLLDLAERIDSLKDERSRLADLHSEISFMEEKLKTLSIDLSQQLSHISPDWKTEDLQRADTSLAAGKEGLELINRFNVLENEYLQAKLLFERAVEEKDHAMEELSQARMACSEYGDNDETVETVSKLIDDLRKTGELLLQREHLHENIRSLEGSLEDYRERLEAVDSMAEIFETPIQGSFLTYSAILVIAGIPPVHYWLGSVYSVFYTTLSMIFLFFLMFFWRKHDIKARKSRKTSEKERNMIIEKTEKIKTELSIQEGLIDVLNRELFLLAEMVQDEDFNREWLDEQIIRANLKLAEARERELVFQRVCDLHEKFQKQVKALGFCEDKVTVSRESLTAWQGEWNKYLEDKNLPLNTKPATFQILVQAIISVSRVSMRKHEICEKVKQLKELERVKNEDLDNLFSLCDLSYEAGITERITFLAAKLKESTEAQGKISILEKEYGDLLTQRTEYKQRCECALSEMEELMNRSNAVSEEIFFSRIEEYGRLAELKNLEMELVARLIGLAGNEKLLEKLVEKLNNVDILALEMDLENNTEKINVMSRKREEIIRSLAKVEMRLQELSLEDSQSRLIQEKEFLNAKCRENSMKWAALAACRALLAKAREIHEIQRQPRVTKMAGKYMEIITGGRYGLLCSSLDRRIFLSDKRTLVRKGSQEWSSGLADQAYLAIRLAVTRSLSGTSGVLPVILDDIHLRFDLDRQKNLAEVLMEHSCYQQVFFFSCNPAFLEMLSSVIKETESTPGIYRIKDGLINEGLDSIHK